MHWVGCLPSLGWEVVQLAGLQILNLAILVRVQASQPINNFPLIQAPQTAVSAERKGSRQRIGSKPPEYEHRRRDYCDASKQKAKHHKAFLPWQSTVTCPSDWGKGRRTKNRSKRRYQPVPVSTAKCRPVGDRLLSRGQPYFGPNGSQRKEESAIHHTFQVRRKSHARVGKLLLSETSQQPDQKQEHAVPH